MAYRVIQYGTGFVGSHALRGIIQHPELELVGLVVFAGPTGEDKTGRDAGELCGLDPVGVLATPDINAAIAMEADAFCYLAAAWFRIEEVVDEFCRILASGKNIVSTSLSALIDPLSAPPQLRDRIEEACRQGGTTCYCTGIDPGFFSDYLPVVLSGCFERIDSIRIYELATYPPYLQADEVAFDILGFGQPLDASPPIVQPEGLLDNWAGVVSQIAGQLGVKLDDIVTSYELHPADEKFEFQGRQIEAGTIAALRFEIAGVVAGEKRIAVEHVTRTRDDLAPQWPHPLQQDAYRIVIDGSPHLECEFQFQGEDGGRVSGAYNITAMRAVNAIPTVCEAKPGLISVFDLPMITGLHRMAGSPSSIGPSA